MTKNQTEIQKNVLLKNFSTFGVGGYADYFIAVYTPQDLIFGLDFAKQHHLPLFLLGGGSNIVFSDKGFKGIVIHFQNKKIISQGNGIFTIEAGAKMGEIFGKVKKEERDFSLFSTIPGTIGGAVAGNAGLPQQEIKDVFLSALVFDHSTQKCTEKDASFFQFAYRKTAFHQPHISQRYSIWSVTLQLPYKAEPQIEKELKTLFMTRKQKQPWGKTGGSFFSNPPEGAAGYFLEKSGLKGVSVGDAFFSEKHANFLMNKKNATQSDIKTLARMAIKTVQEHFGVTLCPEVKILNEFGKKEKFI